jgi:nitrate reductase gamma subunit
MEALTANMIKQSDIQGRLRLFRYGLVVITVVTFVLGIVYPWAALRSVGISQPMTSYLSFALIATIVVAIVMVIIYFVYAEILKRTISTGN